MNKKSLLLCVILLLFALIVGCSSNKETEGKTVPDREQEPDEEIAETTEGDGDEENGDDIAEMLRRMKINLLMGRLL